MRPARLAYRRQFWATASAAARGRGPAASLPGPGAVPHPPLTRAPCPSRCRDGGPGGIRYTARHRTIARLPLPGHRAVGMIPARPSPAPSPPWPGSDGAARGHPGAAGMAWRDWRWRAANASCREPLVPTGPQSPALIFSNYTILAGVPLRNRTVDLLLTIEFRSARRPGISPEGQIRGSASAQLGQVQGGSRRMRPPRFLPTAHGGGARARSRLHPVRYLFDMRRSARALCRSSPERAQRRQPPADCRRLAHISGA